MKQAPYDLNKNNMEKQTKDMVQENQPHMRINMKGGYMEW